METLHLSRLSAVMWSNAGFFSSLIAFLSAATSLPRSISKVRDLMIEIRLCSRDYNIYIAPLFHRPFPHPLTSPSSTSPRVWYRGEAGRSSPVSSLVLSSSIYLDSFSLVVLRCSQLPRISCRLGRRTTFYRGSSIFSSSPISNFLAVRVSVPAHKWLRYQL